MLLDLLAVDIYLLLTHNPLKMESDILAGGLLRHDEVLAIPSHPLIITATARLCGHKLHGMRCRYHFPSGVIQSYRPAIGHITEMETPS